MSGRHSTCYSLDHIERLTRSLHQILGIDFRRPLSFEACLGVVRAGLSLYRRNTSIVGTYSGHPWSTSAALNYLAGRGYLFDPRAALDAIERLEARHIIDRRRIDYRAAQRRDSAPRRDDRRAGRLGRVA